MVWGHSMGSGVASRALAEDSDRVDGLILENMHDTPYCLARDLEPHITATMTVLASRVRNMVRDPSVPVGVQVSHCYSDFKTFQNVDKISSVAVSLDVCH